MLNTPWPPTDWAYPEYRANIDAAPERTPRPMPDMGAVVYDHSADAPADRVSWKIIATVIVALPIVMYLAWCFMLGVARGLAGVS